MPTPWKIDITLLDLSGYSSNGAEVFLLDDGQLVVRVSSEWESGLYDDFFVEDHRTTLLTSTDGGITWEDYDGSLPAPGADAPDGTRVYIGNQGLSGDALREHLEREGLGHLYTPDGQMAYRLYKEEKRAELEAQGHQVNDAFEGIVAVYPEIATCRSVDGGQTWTRTPIENAPRGDAPVAAHTVGFFGRTIVLDDGTMMGTLYGRLNRTDTTTRVWVARTTDSGHTWTFNPVFSDPDDRIGYNETHLLRLRSGRIIALARPQFPTDHNMWQNVSDDGGVTWTEPKQVPFWGYPGYPIQLTNGDLLVTYAHRRHPVGVRACVSSDDGDSWDIDNEKVIRNDSLPKGVGYPQSVELADGNILSVYAMSKIDALKPEDEIGYGKKLVLHPWFHTVACASKYTPDYVRARGQASIQPEGVHPRRTGPGTDQITESPQR